MDLHSDNDLDFGDGDIELDLDSAPVNVPQHDDVLINDAASLTGLDAHTMPADQDDFMVDHEDLIDEDDNYQIDSSTARVEQPPTNSIAPAQPPVLALAPPDEDLLDYSDDEGEPTKTDPAFSLEQEQSEPQRPHEATPEHHDPPQDIAQTALPDNSGTFEQEELPSIGNDAVNQNSRIAEGETEEQEDSDDDQPSQAYKKRKHQPSSSLGRVPKASEGFADDSENKQSDHGAAPGDHDYSDASPDNGHQDQQTSNLQPVTVNYAGNELWLFKQHDLDESGDWLLEDISLATSSMSDFFHACRVSLGDDVSNEHEIGLRFDHLHNLELYEDNTACVAVSLQRLVGLYYTLHAQDDNKEPESFYCSLLFRPRFVTLLSDIAKYAEQGSGYSGLDAAIGAGETHFSNALSSASTEHEQTDWDEEEQEEEEADFGISGSANYDAQLTGDQTGDQDQEEPAAQAAYTEDHGLEGDDGQDYSNRYDANVAHAEYSASDADDASHSQPEAVGPVDAATLHFHDEEDAQARARHEQEQDDLLDYSDDEGAGDAKAVQATDAKEPSASSSTVQGDETAPATAATEENEPTVSYPEDDNQNHGTEHEVPYHEENEHGNQFDDQLLEGIDDTAQSYQNYDQGFNQDDSYQDFRADGGTDQNYADFEYQALDPQLQLDFLSGAEFDGVDNTTATANDFAGTDDFLDLNHGSEWTADQDIPLNLADTANAPDDQTGQDIVEEVAVEHPTAAVSSAADPGTASSVEIDHVSPQGHKRSVDEAGHGTDNAPDSIGMLGGAVSLKRTSSADLFLPDSKRPRV